MSVAETALSVIAGFVVVAGLIGMLTTLLAGLGEAAPPSSPFCARWGGPCPPLPAAGAGGDGAHHGGHRPRGGRALSRSGLAGPWLLSHYGLQMSLGLPRRLSGNCWAWSGWRAW